VIGDATQRLLDQAGEGDGPARHELLERYRGHLRRFIAARLDPRIAQRVDASDIAQETLAEAAEGMDTYLKTRPLTFLGWLRQLARSRVIDARRYHLDAKRRSVIRERSISELHDDNSAERLTNFLAASGRSLSGVIDSREMFDKVMAILDTLPPRDRQILMMWYVEQKDVLEMADALGLTAHGVKTRHIRALRKLRDRLESPS
jgi:RNA polymerase sigma-70 factor, ECF subfamily